MIGVIAVFLFLLIAAGAFVGANFCAAGGIAQQSLIGLGGALIGACLPSIPGLLQSYVVEKRNTQAGHGTPSLLFLLAFAGLATFAGTVLTTSTSGCKQTKPDVFFAAVVDCAKINPEASAASAAVITCITAAVSGNPAACLSGLVTGAHFTVDEVACIVAALAKQNDDKVKATNDPEAARIRDIASDWLVREHIRIANTYAGAP